MKYLYFKQLGEYGRLGNQLFQIAATIGIAKANGMQPLFPANWKYRDCFNVPDEYFGYCNVEDVYQEPFFHFTVPCINPDKNTELRGYFQAERYFLNHREDVLKWLMPKDAQPLTVNAISVHHRRGDYVGNTHYHQLSMAYYLNAIDHAEVNEVRAFSDDINYIDLHWGGNTLAAKQDDEITDLKNMIACKTHIVSNSTFSFWAAYLSGSEQVYRPQVYFAGSSANLDTREFWPFNWWVVKDEKFAMPDLTVIIPVQFDHEDRAQNMEAVVKYLKKHFDVKIIVGEVSTTRFRNMQGIEYAHFTMGQFHRTKVLNELTRLATTKYVINYDADVIVPPVQMYSTYKLLQSGADIVYPFKDVFANVPRGMLSRFVNGYDAGTFAGVSWPWMRSGFKSVGGAVAYNKESFLEAGGENEGFVSYGPEDQERYHRFKGLGLRVEQVPGTIFHIDHHRGQNSGERHPMARHNIDLFNVVKKMDGDRLRAYIKSDIYNKPIIPTI